jgi:uncharacterized protein (TIGR00661 family)
MNRAKYSGKVLFSILNMGLGHATRSLPIIIKLLDLNWEVFLASSGRSLTFLSREIKNATFIELPDYGLYYSEKGVQIGGILIKAPRLLKKICMEHKLTEALVKRKQIDLVISDHRYGCYSYRAPSFFISHQLRFIAPKSIRHLEFLGVFFNRIFHRKFTGIIVPDTRINHEGLLSGKLSYSTNQEKYFYPGTLSSIQRDESSEVDIDLFISISGPEPQRTVMERIVRSQVQNLSGSTIVSLGIPESQFVESPGPNLTIHHHLRRSEMESLMNRSRLIITRAGYSTIMELAELGKKALLIPTPGQTEQIYLSQRLQNLGYFYLVPQEEVSLQRDISIAKGYPGIKNHFSTSQTLVNILDILEKFVPIG